MTTVRDTLVTALRQYRHNNNNLFVTGYDKADTEIIVGKLMEDIEELKALLGGDLRELPRIDLGQAVTPEEKQALTDNALIHHGEPQTTRRVAGCDCELCDYRESE